MKRRALRRRYGHAGRRGVFSVATVGHLGGYLRSHKTRAKAIEEAKYLENRGYEPIVYEFNEEAPERHRVIIYGPGIGKVAPPYRGHG